MLPFPKNLHSFPPGLTFCSPPDDAQSTSERKREHLPFSSCTSAAFPQGFCLRESEGELLGSEVPLSKHYPCWHVHFLTRDKEKMDAVLFPTLSPSLRHRGLCPSCCFHILLPLWRTSSPVRWVFPSQSRNRCRFVKEERFRSNTVPVFFPQPLLVTHFLQFQTATSWLAK